MNKKLINTLVLMIITLSVIPAYSQIFTAPEYYERNMFFVMGGVLHGPKFDEFTDWANQYYTQLGATEKIKDFGNTFGFSIGLRTRFAYHFALEVDFSTSTKTTKRGFTTADGIIIQELELNVAEISASVPVIFQFSDRQRVVPFLAAGVAVFPIRLDQRIDFWERHTKTALAGNFSAGIDTKISGRLWATLRGDWTYGKTDLDVAHPINGPDHFELNLNTTQIQAGIMYAFQ